MKEEDIRPSSVAADQEIAMLRDIGRLLSRRHEFIESDCPACASPDRSVRFRKYGLVYWECECCRTVYISPRPSAETLDWFYRESVNYAFFHQYTFPQSNEARRNYIVIPRVEKFLADCRKVGINSGSVLEIGPGFGTFGVELRSRGGFDRIVAIEPTPDLAAHCRGLGLEILEARFEEVTFPPEQRFDAIVCFEVLEHVLSPREFLRHCRNVLRPGGLMSVTCPNIDGFDIVTLGVASDSIDVEHLNYFNPSSLSQLFSSCGFEVVSVDTPGELDAELVRNKVLRGEFSLDGQPWLKKILIEDWNGHGQSFQAFLKVSGLSSHLRCSAVLKA
jgi:SAM-dependent methyltransferase